MSDEEKLTIEDPKALAEYLVAKAMEAVHPALYTDGSARVVEEGVRERMNNAAQTITNEVGVLGQRIVAAFDEATKQRLRAEKAEEELLHTIKGIGQ